MLLVHFGFRMEVHTSNNFKIIDLLTEEKKYRFAYQEKAVHGITDKKAAVDASKKYSGQWQGETFIVAESDREKYVERSLLEAMAQLRSSAPQKAATGAILRVIRELLGIKSMYTIDELKSHLPLQECHSLRIITIR